MVLTGMITAVADGFDPSDRFGDDLLMLYSLDASLEVSSVEKK